jgi:tripartite-type tricarboxylate transporter receptor subunit TctC
MPQVPTIAESGYADYEMVPWLALLAPRGLAQEPRQVLVKALAETLADPTTRAELEKVGIDVAYAPPPAYELRVNQELPKVRAYVQRAKISAD